MTQSTEQLIAEAIEWHEENKHHHGLSPNLDGGIDLVKRLVEALEASEQELNTCRIEYGDVRDSYTHYKQLVEANEWVDVNERLPDEGQRVWLYYPEHDVTIAAHITESTQFPDNGYWKDNSLPAPPTQESSDE